MKHLWNMNAIDKVVIGLILTDGRLRNIIDFEYVNIQPPAMDEIHASPRSKCIQCHFL